MTNRKTHKLISMSLFIIIALIACNIPLVGNKPEVAVPPQGVDTWHVTTYLDTFDKKCTVEDCSLRDAVYQANEVNRPITIYLPGGLYILNNIANGGIEDDTAIYGDLDIFGDITITGDGIDVSNISADHQDRIFHIFDDGSLELRDLTILNGKASDEKWVEQWSYAKCAANPIDTVFGEINGPEIDCVWFPESVITLPGYERKREELGGGAIANRGRLRLYNVGVVYNTADKGGAIKNWNGTFIMEGGFICNNSADTGGAVYNQYGDMDLRRVGICNNEAFEKGGAIYTTNDSDHDLETIYLENVTMGENIAPSEGGIFYLSNNEATMQNVTIYYNSSIGIVVEKGQLLLQNTLLAKNGDQNCSGEVISLGHNMETGNSCNFNPALDFILVQSPGLSALTELGGWYPLQPNSPAIDTGSGPSCPSVDQQGKPRVSGLGCDIGADEFQTSVDVPIESTPLVNIQPTAIRPAEEVAPVTPATHTNVPPTAPPPTKVLPTDMPPTAVPPTPTTILVPDPMNASISGKVWNDNNGNGSQDGGENGLTGLYVQLGVGACGSSGLATLASNFVGGYAFTGLAGGTYCVSVQRAESCGDITTATTPKQVTVVLQPGDSVQVFFGFQKTIC